MIITSPYSINSHQRRLKLHIQNAKNQNLIIIPDATNQRRESNSSTGPLITSSSNIHCCSSGTKAEASWHRTRKAGLADEMRGGGRAAARVEKWGRERNGVLEEEWEEGLEGERKRVEGRATAIVERSEVTKCEEEWIHWIWAGEV